MAYCLEMRSTQDWSDVRYREYTTSKRKADRFKQAVPRINFTDSGHGIIPVVNEHYGRREKAIYVLADHVREALASPPAL